MREIQNDLGELMDIDSDICNILRHYFTSVYLAIGGAQMSHLYIRKEIEPSPITTNH